MKTETVEFSKLANFTPKQLEAERLSDLHKYFLFGGAKMGSKSYWLRWRLLRLLLRAAKLGFRNCKAALFCEDYPTLNDRQVGKIEAEFPSWLGRLGSTQTDGLCFKIRPEYGGGALHLRNLDDPSKYDSVEYAFIAVDELTKNTERTFTHLRTILRWTNMDWCKFIAGTNPGGIGGAWVKKRFIDKQYEIEEKEAHQFAFLQSLITDNPFASQAYIEQLESLPEKLKQAYRYGNWDVFEGQFFTEWDRAIHVIPFYQPVALRKYLCMDWGYNAPSAVYWAAIDYDNRRIHYREIYQNELTPENLGSMIVQMTDKDEHREILGMYCDPSIWSKDAGNTEIAVRIQRTFDGLKFPVKLIPANNDREAGALQMRELLRPYKNMDGNMTAKLLFTENCTHAIRTIPGMVHDKQNPEKYCTKGEDHSGDSVRYGLSCDSAPKPSLKGALEINKGIRQLSSAGAYW